MRGGTFDVVLEANCEGVVNPLMDTQKYLPRSVYTENYGMYDDQTEIDLYQKMLHEPDAAKQRVLMREFEKRVVDTEAHPLKLDWMTLSPVVDGTMRSSRVSSSGRRWNGCRRTPPRERASRVMKRTDVSFESGRNGNRDNRREANEAVPG